MASKKTTITENPPSVLREITIPPILLLLAVLLVFFPVIGQEFLAYDDLQNIAQNELVTHLAPATLARLWSKPFAGMYIPLSYTLWSVEATLALNPALFHAVNLLLHLANALLVFYLLRRLVKNEWSSLVGALLFAVHPVQVEAVAWITGGKDLLCAFFSLLALRGYLDSANVPAGGRGAKASYGLALAFFLAALLAKPAALSLPLVAGVIGLLWLNKTPRQLLAELAPWAALALPLVGLTKLAQPDVQLEFLPTLGQRLLIGGDTLSFYLRQVVAPLQLGPDYGRTPQWVLAHNWVYLSGTISYLLLALLTWMASPRYRAPLGIFLAALLPVLGLLSFTFQNISTVADRYLYLALLGPALAVSWLLGQRKHKAVWGVTIAILLLFASKSVSQVPVWANTLSLGQAALAVNPRSWTAAGLVGNALAEQNRPAEALAYYQQALTFKPEDEKSTFNLALTNAELDRPEAAIAAYRRTIALVTANPAKGKEYKQELLRDAYSNLGLLYSKSRRPGEAIAAFRQALAQSPEELPLRLNLALAYYQRQEFAEASREFQLLSQTKNVAPEIAAEAYNGLGAIAMAQGRWPAAEKALHEALQYAPDHRAAQENLAKTQAELAKAR